MNLQWRPYRLLVFGTSQVVTGRGKRTRTRTISWGIVAWNPDHTVESGRLPGSGSFIWPGLHAVRREALAQLARPEVDQVVVRTNQDQGVYRYCKRADGTVSGHLTDGG